MGISPREFDEMTPRELWIYAEGYREQQQGEAQRMKLNAYLTARLTAQFVWAKRIPAYDDTFSDQKSGEAMDDETMDDEAMFRRVRAINALLGGQDTFGKEAV